jgi:hypothetical protein
MPLETGKQRRSRIELDYYKRRDALARWKIGLGLGAAALALGWIALAPLLSSGRGARVELFQWSRLASPGPVARAHALWESNCESCHTPFQPINGSRWSPLNARNPHASDAKCQACHAGPEHHATQRQSEVAACAGCHTDHKGREASLTMLDDAVCTSCHADLDAHVDGGAVQDTLAQRLQKIRRSTMRVVTRFDDANHPEFFRPRSGIDDLGHLRFNHALHLAPGLTRVPGGAPFTLGQLSEPERKRYGGSADTPVTSVVQLACDSCHILDAGEAQRASLWSARLDTVPLRSDGAYMLPVTYAEHCRACHPLSFDARVPYEQVTHGVQPSGVVEELRRFYAHEALREDPVLLRRWIPARSLPSKPEDAVTQDAGSAIDAKLTAALRLLFVPNVTGTLDPAGGTPRASRRGCLECHLVQGLDEGLIDAKNVASSSVIGPSVPRIWFSHARFDHSAHRSMDCDSCHTGVVDSTTERDILLPGKGKCLECHSAGEDRASSAGGAARSGAAGSSCTTCHRYHNGDHPLEGIGASARGPRKPK